MSDRGTHAYYLARRPQIAADLEESLRLVKPAFDELLPSVPLDTLRPSVMDELSRVLEFLPYAGGAEGRMTQFFEQGAGIIALGRVLRERGVPGAVMSVLMKKTFLARLAAMPREQRHALGRQWLSPENQAYLRREALGSEHRENPGDWVYSFVEAGATDKGETFDFGLDYSECGFCKMCKAGGDEDLLPHFCAMDHESYGMRGITLYRSTTIAGGDERCNFRFKALPETGEGKA